jgi:hypothetical protein
MSNATAALMGDNGGGDGAAAGIQNPATTGTNPASAAINNGAQAPWYGQVDEATTAYITNKGWDNPVKAIESYRNLEKFAGGSKSLLEIPGPDADEAKMGEFYNRLGRPESPDKYDIKPPEGGDPELTEWFKGTAHKYGLTSKQAGNLFNDWNQMAAGKGQAMAAEAQQNSEKEIAALKKEWGQGYEKQIDMGKRAVTALGFNEQQLSDYEAKLGTGEMLKLFSVLGSKMGESSFEGGERNGSTGFGLTPAAAQQQIADLKTDKQFMEAYLNGSPEHVAKMKRLNEAAYAG